MCARSERSTPRRSSRMGRTRPTTTRPTRTRVTTTRSSSSSAATSSPTDARVVVSRPMTDDEILDQIHQLVDDEHELRRAGAAIDADRMRQLEETLDQCWDLLRQRRAKREFEQDPDEAQ